MNPQSLLRQLPAIDEVLQHSWIQPILEATPRSQVKEWTRHAVDELRQEIVAGMHEDESELLNRVLQKVLRAKDCDNCQRMLPVLNGTGVLLHTNLGRAPLAQQAVARMQAVAGYTNLEMDLSSGKRSKRGERVCRLLAKLTGAEDALVVNNCAAATMLVLQGIAAGKEVIVSRGQLVEIGGGFRLPDVFEAAGVRLREVGTTNRTYLRDYETAVGEETGALLRVHRSNFHQSGFVCEPTVGELVHAKRPAGIPVIDDLGSGHVVDLSGLDLPSSILGEPRVQGGIRDGADLCLFSGDKLFGGPQSGIIVGRSSWISQLARHPMMRALRPDKLTLAGLEATVEIHLAGKSCQEIPFFQMLTAPQAVIQSRCEEVLSKINAALRDDIKVSVTDCNAQIGGGSMPGTELASCALAIRKNSGDANELAAQLRSGSIAIHGRIHDGMLLLDLRTVLPSQQSLLTQALEKHLCQ